MNKRKGIPSAKQQPNWKTSERQLEAEAMALMMDGPSLQQCAGEWYRLIEDEMWKHLTGGSAQWGNKEAGDRFVSNRKLMWKLAYELAISNPGREASRDLVAPKVKAWLRFSEQQRRGVGAGNKQAEDTSEE